MTDLKASEVQVGGTHYKQCKIQPYEYVRANDLGHLEGDAIAYITRWKFKNGLQDIRKAIHTLQLLLEFEERAVETLIREDEDA